jgi:hypothetical protein
MPSIALPVSLRGQLLSGTRTFSPSSLFAAGEPGVWYDPSDVANLNWRRNLLTYSEQFDNAAWGTFQSVKVDADTFRADSGGGVGFVFISQAITTAGAVAHAISIDAQYTNTRWFWLEPSGIASLATRAWFDVQNGVVGSRQSGVTSSSIQDLGGGWYRCTMIFTGDAADTSGSLRIAISNADNSSDASRDGVSSVNIRRAQFEVGSVATDYQRITDVNTEIVERFPTATLYQDVAGTIPVTGPTNLSGNPSTVALMLDKSKGLTLGAELVVNGNFSDGSAGWSTGATTVISSGVATSTATPSGSTILQQATLLPPANTLYQVKFDVTGWTAGDLRVFINNTNVTLTGANKSYSLFILNSDVTGVGLLIRAQNSSFTGSIDNISVKELPGNHATQGTIAARPTYSIEPVGGRRNNITFSEQFDNSVWKFSNPGTTTIADQTSAPNSTLTADELREDTTTGTHRMFGYSTGWTTTTGLTYTFSIYVKANGRTIIQLAPSGIGLGGGVLFDLVAKTAGAGGAIQDVGSGWYRCSVTGTSPSGGLLNPVLTLRDAAGVENYTGNGTSGIYIWGAQFETGSTATNYQRVTTTYDVTEAGVASLGYLFFDGSGDFMVTPTITPGTDKAQIFAGVRKLSEASLGMVAELSAGSGNGRFFISAPRNTSTENYSFYNQGTSGVDVVTAGSFAAPITNTLTALGDISGDNTVLRVSGVQAGQSSTDMGTGNYLAYTLYIGARSGGLFPLSGHLYSLITRFGPNLDAPTIANTETYVAGKTGITL